MLFFIIFHVLWLTVCEAEKFKFYEVTMLLFPQCNLSLSRQEGLLYKNLPLSLNHNALYPRIFWSAFASPYWRCIRNLLCLFVLTGKRICTKIQSLNFHKQTFGTGPVEQWHLPSTTWAIEICIVLAATQKQRVLIWRFSLDYLNNVQGNISYLPIQTFPTLRKFTDPFFFFKLYHSLETFL